MTLPEESKFDDLLDERGAIDEITEGALTLKLDGYGFRWFRITTPDRAHGALTGRRSRRCGLPECALRGHQQACATHAGVGLGGLAVPRRGRRAPRFTDARRGANH